MREGEEDEKNLLLFERGAERVTLVLSENGAD